MDVNHISNIKYKGFHPNDKKETIKDINLLIDKFNEDNQRLYNYFFNKENPHNLNDVSEKAISKELEIHRNYLLLHLHNIKFNVLKLNDRLAYNREREFQKFVDSITQDPQKNIETIRKEVFNWYANEKKFIKNEEKKLNIAVEESARMETKNAVADIETIQERKRKKSLNAFDELITKIKKDHKSNKKADEVLLALEKLKVILSHKGGNITQDILKTLVACFGKNRNWSAIKRSEKIIYPPIPKSDSVTNQVIINLYSMMTDDGTNIAELVEKYIKPR